VGRRERLRRTIERDGAEGELRLLLAEVDAALARVDQGTYGACLVCGEEVLENDLRLNPLLEYCLCSLSSAQQRALEQDLNLARRLQSGLLPEPLDAGGWTARYRYEPAGVVSGDYCDLYVHPSQPGNVFFALADVAGKGVAACLLMGHLQAACRSLFGTGMPLSDLVDSVNRLFLSSDIQSHYATLVCGRAEPNGHVEIVNAGHCPPLVVRESGIEAIGATGVPVGVLSDQVYERREITLDAGDLLVLYTDGLTEARGVHGEEYGHERVARAVARRAGALDTVHALRADVATFLAGAAPADDLTVLALHRGT